MSIEQDPKMSGQPSDPYHVEVPRVPVPDLVNGQPHWLVRPSTIRLLWWVFGVILALTVIAQIFIHLHEYFTLDGFFGFYAIFGFVSCLAMVVFAKLLGVFLKRPDTYYDDL